MSKRISHLRVGRAPLLRSSVAPSLLIIVTACLSTGVRSTGTALPQASTEFQDSELAVTIEHHCAEGRCSGLKANFKNLSDRPVEIVISGTKISRSGEVYSMRQVGESQSNPVLPPKGETEIDLQAYKGSQTFSYFKAREVWCSLKVDSACQSPPKKSVGECAGIARSYYETYIKTGGWIGVTFAYRNQGKVVTLSNAAPGFMGDAPTVDMKPSSLAPNWSQNSGDIVFYKLSCDAQCNCTPEEKKPDFFLNDKFRPIAH